MTEPSDRYFLRLFPLEAVVLFPGTELPLMVFEPRYRQLIQECLDTQEPFGVVLLRSGNGVGDAEAMPHEVGTTAHIKQVEELDEDRLRVTAMGRDRFRVASFSNDQPYLSAQVEYLPQDPGRQVPSELVQRVKDVSMQCVQALVALRGGYAREVALPDAPEELSYLVALLLQGRRRTQQRLLETDSTQERLTAEAELLAQTLPRLRGQVEERWQSGRFSGN